MRAALILNAGANKLHVAHVASHRHCPVAWWSGGCGQPSLHDLAPQATHRYRGVGCDVNTAVGKSWHTRADGVGAIGCVSKAQARWLSGSERGIELHGTAGAMGCDVMSQAA
jgi:hypothetical protein